MAENLLITAKYPGRDRVISRDAARDVLFNERMMAEGPSGDTACHQPIEYSAIGLPSMLEPASKPLGVDLKVRCRCCEGCLKHRSRLWTARAIDEISFSNRTWFGTLTVAPDYRWVLKGKAEQRVISRRRETFSSLTPAEQYKAIAEHLSKECTDWLKRVRKSAGVPLRYLLVFEAHKDGFPHCHVLIHEPALPVRKALLESKWRYGFSQFRLVNNDPRAARYVCKYLAKDALTRVRASIRYGQRQVAVLTERIEEATRCATKITSEFVRKGSVGKE